MGTKHRFLAVLTSTHNLCFGSKIRKIDMPLTPVLLYKSGVYGVYITRIFFLMKKISSTRENVRFTHRKQQRHKMDE